MKMRIHADIQHSDEIQRVIDDVQKGAQCKPGRYFIKAWPEEAVDGLINNNRKWG